VSVVVPVLNERAHLPGLLRCIEAQTLIPLEVIFVDGGSGDGTREWILDARRRRNWVFLADNPAGVIPAAMNIGIAAARGDVVARMDGHAWYSPDYLEQVVGALTRNPAAVGAGGRLVMRGHTAWARAAAAVLAHPVALGGSAHRHRTEPGPVAHVGTGAYRRAALQEVGGFDSTFLANEDFELDHRLRNAGGEIWLEPRATLVSYARPRPRAMARQMWRYGYYRARTIRKHPRSVKPRHLAPPGLLVGLALLSVWRPARGAAAAAVYVAAAGGAGAAIARSGGACPWRGALALPLVHGAWGSGLLLGLCTHRDTGKGHSRADR
jgi:glycosyltransferase involved in cell wall biosynthesis